MTSLVRHGLEAAGFADTFCNAVLMLLNMSILPLTVSFISVHNCCVTCVISCLNCCWNVTISTAMTMSIHKSAAAGAAAPAGDFRRLSSVSTRDVAQRRYATMSNATLFCGNPEPTRMRWCMSDKCLMLDISPSFHCSNNHGTTPKTETEDRHCSLQKKKP